MNRSRNYATEKPFDFKELQSHKLRQADIGRDIAQLFAADGLGSALPSKL
jgi:hypothetical protein